MFFKALGCTLITDVLEISIPILPPRDEQIDPVRSTLWAILTAAIRILDIPEGEIGGTTYPAKDSAGFCVLLYDNAPGGAGRISQLKDDIANLLTTAYNIVADCPDCEENSCCYGCLCSYYNQNEHSILSRGSARDILGELLNGTWTSDALSAIAPEGCVDQTPAEFRVETDDNFSFEGMDPFDIQQALLNNGCSAEETAFCCTLIDALFTRNFGTPFLAAELQSMQGDCFELTVTWPQRKIAYLNASSYGDFHKTFHDAIDSSPEASSVHTVTCMGWTFVTGGLDSNINDVLNEIVGQD
jgi:hypothetical protein